jgi:hypothetical protein
MATSTRCPECDADWADGHSCTDYFHLMYAWELDNQLYDVHHLMVLCYQIQHPRLYSPAGLKWAKQLLAAFVEDSVTPQEMRKRISQAADSGTRTHRIKGTPESHGSFPRPIHWKMRACDVIRAGIDNYYASVRQWAAATLKSLRESGNLD